MAYRQDSRVDEIRETWAITLAEAKTLQLSAAETIEQRKAMQIDLDRQCSAGWESLRLIRQRLAQIPHAT